MPAPHLPITREMHLAILRMLPGGGGRTVSLQMLRNSTCSSHAELLLTVRGYGKPIPHMPERQQNEMAISHPPGAESGVVGGEPALLTLIGYIGATELSLLSVRGYVGRNTQHTGSGP